MNPSSPSSPRNNNRISLCSFSRTHLECLMREHEEEQQGAAVRNRGSSSILQSKTGGNNDNLSFETQQQQRKNTSNRNSSSSSRPSINALTTKISYKAASPNNTQVPAERTARLSFQPPKPLHGTVATIPTAATTNTTIAIPSSHKAVFVSSNQNQKPKATCHREFIEDLGVVVSRLGNANSQGSGARRTLLPPGHRLDIGDEEMMAALLVNSYSNMVTSQDHHSAPPSLMIKNHHHSNRSFQRSSSRRGGSRRSLASNCSSSRRSVMSTGSTAWELEHLTNASIHSGDFFQERPDNPVPFMEQFLNRSLSLDNIDTSNITGTHELPLPIQMMPAKATESSPTGSGTQLQCLPQRPVARRWNASATKTLSPKNCDGEGDRFEL